MPDRRKRVEFVNSRSGTEIAVLLPCSTRDTPRHARLEALGWSTAGVRDRAADRPLLVAVPIAVLDQGHAGDTPWLEALGWSTAPASAPRPWQ
jgi:hypothetical protein